MNPHLMVTDPPYGVEYDPTWRHRAGVNRSARVGKVCNDEKADWREAWALFPGTIAYIWHGALHATTVADSLTREGFTIRAQIIWAKERLVIGRGDYHWQHEPCWYAVRKKGNWTGDRKQTTLWTVPSGDQDTETFHGTQKPVECMKARTRACVSAFVGGNGIRIPMRRIRSGCCARAASGHAAAARLKSRRLK
jgi:DNA modification methylase